MIPVYNEADGIASFLREIVRELDGWPGSVTLVVVDDASTDETYEAVRRLAGDLPVALDLLRNASNVGHGPTVARGYRAALAAGAEFVLQVDGDGQFAARDIRRVADRLAAAGDDVVIGVRRFRVDPWFRRTLTRLLRAYLRLAAGVRAADVNSPLRAYRASTLRALIAWAPADCAIPNIYLTIVGWRARVATSELVVEHSVRRGRSAQGTMWGPSKRSFWIPRRLVRFAVAALVDLLGFLRRLRWTEPSRLLVGADLAADRSCPGCGGHGQVFVVAFPAAITTGASSFTPSADDFGKLSGPLVGCSECGHRWVVMEGNELLARYEAAAVPASPAELAGLAETARRSLAQLERFHTPGTLLDVGCWTGEFLEVARRLGWDVRGIEPSAEAAATARAKGIDVMTGALDERAAGLGDARFDVVCFRDVIEHLAEPSQGLAEAWRLLRPEGLLYLTLPNAASRPARLLGLRWWSVMPMHVQYFGPRSLGRLLARNRFEVVASQTHPKTFTALYYAGRLAALTPLAQPLERLLNLLPLRSRLVTPDFGDRIEVIAVRRDRD